MTVARKMCCISALSVPKIRMYLSELSFSYKEFNTPLRLGELTDSKLLSLGVSDKEDRKLVLSALNAAGYRVVALSNAKRREVKKRRAANGTPEAEADDQGDDGDDGVFVSGPENGEEPTMVNHPLPPPAPPKKNFLHEGTNN